MISTTKIDVIRNSGWLFMSLWISRVRIFKFQKTDHFFTLIEVGIWRSQLLKNSSKFLELTKEIMLKKNLLSFIEIITWLLREIKSIRISLDATHYFNLGFVLKPLTLWIRITYQFKEEMLKSIYAYITNVLFLNLWVENNFFLFLPLFLD